MALALACLGVFGQASARHQPLLAKPWPLLDFNSCAKPRYPAAALAAGRTGTVSLGFKVDTSGRVIDSEVNGSSGHRDLDEAARNAIKLCAFKPAVRQGERAPAWALVKYVWTLE